jgi:hypothetical protein
MIWQNQWQNRIGRVAGGEGITMYRGGGGGDVRGSCGHCVDVRGSCGPRS